MGFFVIMSGREREDPTWYSLRHGSGLITVTTLRIFIMRTGFKEAHRQQVKRERGLHV